MRMSCQIGNFANIFLKHCQQRHVVNFIDCARKHEICHPPGTGFAAMAVKTSQTTLIEYTVVDKMMNSLLMTPRREACHG